jgi:hypothetical protein
MEDLEHWSVCTALWRRRQCQSMARHSGSSRHLERLYTKSWFCGGDHGGYYGHVMYVEAVNGDGTITVSDYNFDWDGLYRYYTRSASGLTYVYF